MKEGQSNKYDTTKTLGFVQVWMPFDRKISKFRQKLILQGHGELLFLGAFSKVLNSSTENKGN